MSNLTYRLTELRSILIPIGQLAVWPIFFVLTTAISQQPAYFVALGLVLAADLFDSSSRNSGLLRDAVAGSVTAMLAAFLNDQEGLMIGAAVAVLALARAAQKLRRIPVTSRI